MVALMYFLKPWQENRHVPGEYTSNPACMANILFCSTNAASLDNPWCKS